MSSFGFYNRTRKMRLHFIEHSLSGNFFFSLSFLKVVFIWFLLILTDLINQSLLSWIQVTFHFRAVWEVTCSQSVLTVSVWMSVRFKSILDVFEDCSCVAFVSYLFQNWPHKEFGSEKLFYLTQLFPPKNVPESMERCISQHIDVNVRYIASPCSQISTYEIKKK